MTSTVNATYAKIHLGELLNRVGFNKEKIFIKRNNKTIAVLSSAFDDQTDPEISPLKKFAGFLDLSEKEAAEWKTEIISRRKNSSRYKKL